MLWSAIVPCLTAKANSPKPMSWLANLSKLGLTVTAVYCAFSLLWDHTSVPAKWHLILSDGFSSVHECDR